MSPLKVNDLMHFMEKLLAEVIDIGLNKSTYLCETVLSIVSCVKVAGSSLVRLILTLPIK